MLTAAVFALLAAGMLVTLGMMIYAAQPWGDNYAYQSLAGYLGLLLFMGWCLSPYVALMVAAAWLGTSRRGRWLVAMAALVTTAVGLWAITDAVVIHTDAQSGLIFVVLPLYQWLVVVLVLALGFWLTRKP